MIAKQVKKTMIDQDITLKKLAEVTGYKYVHLSHVINGKYNSIRAKKVIALALGKDFYELWGSQDNGT